VPPQITVSPQFSISPDLVIQAEKKAANNQPKGWYQEFKEWLSAIDWTALATWALVVVAIWAGCIALDTVTALKRQVDHMIASERAWLTVKVLNFEEPDPKSNMIWIEVPIINHGRTPARVNRIAATAKLVPVPTDTIADATPGKLPSQPDYSDKDRLMELSGYDLIIAPGDTFNHHVYIWPKEWKRVKARDFTLYVYGTIEYFATVGKDPHKTCFCSIYSIPAPNFNEPTGFMFTRYIPATYFCAT
jgi:hypothetical protein